MSKIKQKRLAANMTQQNLAKKLGVKQSTVAMWENGSNIPKAATLPKIAKLLDCSIEEILEG